MLNYTCIVVKVIWEGPQHITALSAGGYFFGQNVVRTYIRPFSLTQCAQYLTFLTTRLSRCFRYTTKERIIFTDTLFHNPVLTACHDWSYVTPSKFVSLVVSDYNTDVRHIVFIAVRAFAAVYGAIGRFRVDDHIRKEPFPAVGQRHILVGFVIVKAVFFTRRSLPGKRMQFTARYAPSTKNNIPSQFGIYGTE